MRLPILGVMLGLLLSILAACDGPQASVTRLVEVTRLVTATPAANPTGGAATRLVVVTATPAANPRRSFTTENPDHFRALVATGPQTLDPALAIDPASRQLVQNVVESLLLPHPQDPETLLPLLATRWEAAEDGLTYTFVIRPGVTFSNGNLLTPADVAYSLQRALLQSVPDSPFASLLEALLGYTSGDVTETIENGAYAGDRAALLNNASARELIVVCEQVKAAIVADDSAGTVTFTLVKPWAPFPAALSRPWTSILDHEWTVEQGAWDGNCETWAEWYAPAPTESVLATTIMGTGPYILDHWTPGAEYVLLSNDDYWRQASMPMMADGPAGMPAIKKVTVRQEPDDRLRWQALRDGKAETADLSPEAQLLAQQLLGEICNGSTGQCRAGEGESGPLRLYTDLTLPSRHALFFNFNVTADDNNFIGSGQLDGRGIPPEFFSDVHIRRAFAYCFDEARYIELALNGNGRLGNTLLPAYYSSAGTALPPTYGFQPQACASELAAAWDGLLPDTGFYMQIPFESGSETQQTVALLLQEGLSMVNSDYEIDIVGLARPHYLRELQEGNLPFVLLNWSPLLPDPHSWVAPAFSNEVLSFQGVPEDMRDRFLTLVEEATLTSVEEARRGIYQSLDVQRHDLLPHLLLPGATGSHYQQRWVRNWFYHPIFAEPYYYAYTLNGS